MNINFYSTAAHKDIRLDQKRTLINTLLNGTKTKGKKQQDTFLPTSKREVASKNRYDERYRKMTEAGSSFFNNYEPGDIWKVGGKEYILSDDRTLNIPYGEDIYDLEAPCNYKRGVKIN